LQHLDGPETGTPGGTVTLTMTDQAQAQQDESVAHNSSNSIVLEAD